MNTVTESLQTATTALSQALETENMSDIASTAHHLKGVLLKLGMQQQAQCTVKNENHALADELEGCHVLMTKLCFDLREFLELVSRDRIEICMLK